MAKYSLAIILLCLPLILAISAFGSGIGEWVSFTDSYGNNVPSKTNITEESNDGIVVEMEVNGMNVEQKLINGSQYQSLTIPMSAWTNETGKPKLPVVRTLVVVPSDGNIQVIVEEAEQIELDNYNVYPVGRQAVKNGRNGTVYVGEEFTIDKDFYSSDEPYPQNPAMIAYSGYMREQRLVQLEFHPLIYRPSSQKLTCYSYMRIRLKFNENPIMTRLSQGILKNAIGGETLGNVSMSPQESLPVGRIGIVDYPDEFMSTKDADYIIIASAPFYSSTKLKELAEWRAKYSGLDIVVVPNDKLYKFGSISTPDVNIRNFVQHAYNYWKSDQSPDGKIRYVLIIGDSEYIPTHISDRMSFDEYIATDNWYASVSGDDLFPDVMIGRLPAKNLSELNIMIDKIIQYEKNPLYGNWSNNALLMVGTVDILGRDLEYARDEYIIPDGYNVTELSVLDGDDANDVISAFNKGQYIVDYAGHGYIDMWEIMRSSDIPKLKNNRMLPAIFSLACSTGYFDNKDRDSLAEAFVKSRNGAIAFFGSSRLAAISGIGFGLSEAVAGSHVYNLGEIAMHAKLKLLPFSSDLELYNLIGDPALDLGAPRRRPNTPDIAILPSDIQFEPENPKQGEEITITLSMENYGVGDARNIVVEFYDGNPKGSLIEKKELSFIRAGGKAQVSIQWRLALGIPLHNVYAKVYSMDGPVEFYGENNDAQKQLIVSLERDGWPIELDENSLSAPVIADIDLDGSKEILFQNQSYDRYSKIYALKSSGEKVNGWPKSIYRKNYDYQSQYSNSSVGIIPSIGDLDGDGVQEIVSTFFSSEVFAWEPDGTTFDGWPVQVSGIASSSPVLADVDQDGKLDVIIGTTSGRIYVFRYDGTQVPGWPISTGKRGHLFVAIADLDGDSDIEIVAYDSQLPRNYDDNRKSNLYAWHHDGTPVAGWPVQMKGSEAIIPVVTGDLDGNGKSEVVAISTWSEECRLYIWNGDGTLKSSVSLLMDDEVRTAPALADIDGDGDIEIIATSYDNFIYAWHHDGRLVYGWPTELVDAYWLTAPIFADVDGDNSDEVIALSHGGVVYAYETDGKPTKGWPAIIGDRTSSSPPAVADIDSDMKSELVYFSNYGNIHLLSLISDANGDESNQWSMLLHDQRHTASYGSSSILPSAPINIQASDTPDDKGKSITISWQSPTENSAIVAYFIYRSEKSDGKYIMIGKTTGEENVFVDDSVETGITHWYMVRASNGTNLSANMSSVSAYSFNNFAPKIPVSLYINNVIIDGAIDVWWTMNNETDIAGYKVYFGESSGEYEKVYDAGLVSHYVLTALENGKKYFACISSYDIEDNESLKSMEVSAIPKDEDTKAPTFSSFYPGEVAENADFYVKCNIDDESGIHDDETASDGQGVYLIWDVGILSEESNVMTMSRLPSGEYITDERISGQPIEHQIVYKVIAYDADYDWERADDRTKGVSEEQLVSFIAAPRKAYNYPNPAPAGAYTDKTIFRYYVDSNSEVTINIYDISGHLVESLDSYADAGRYSETEWNISDVASGIYIYTIEIQSDVGNKQIVKNKLAILK